MRRAPLARGKPLARARAPMRQRRDQPRRSGRVRDVPYMVWVKTLACVARGLPGHVCAGPIEADHAGPRPLGRKADDRTCIPLCQLGHRERTDHTGCFRFMSKAEMRSWLDGQIAATQARRGP
jgi:hypothetical protein